MTLSKCQRQAEDAFLDFVQDPTMHEMVIAGPAGTGKTYLTKYLQRQIPAVMQMKKLLGTKDDLRTAYTATTNKAAAVLSQLTGQQARTIHSFLGLQIQLDFRTGKARLKAKRPVRHRNTLVFIDEASMVSRELRTYIKDLLLYKDSGNKIVYIGDQYQLPPVMEAGTPLFQKLPNQIHLTEIQRQAKGSPIITAAHQFREVLDLGKGALWPKVQDTGKEIRLVEGWQMQDLMDAKYPTATGPDDFKFVAWTNSRVKHASAHIRQVMGLPQEFTIDEYVMVNEAMVSHDEVIFSTDQMVQITDMEPAVSEDGFEGWKVELNHSYVTFVAKHWTQVRDLQKAQSKNKDWVNFFLTKQRYADLRDVHAQTCHKAQGSTYGEVFIDLADIGRCNKWEEVARMVYVAISRAKDAVYLYGELPMKWR